MNPAVAVRKLSYTFPGRDRPTLREIDFALPTGTATLLAGRTGSGKSTLLRILAGMAPRLAECCRGMVQLEGEPIDGLPPARRAQRVGLVLQSPDDQLCTLTPLAEVAFGLENLALPPEEIGRRTAEALRRVGLESMALAPIETLSGGQKQRLALAAVLAMRPRVLLLDEPLSQLDPAAADDLVARLRRLRDEGWTLLVAEHRLEAFLPWVDRLMVLDEGSLVADLPAAATEEAETILHQRQLQFPRLPAGVRRAAMSADGRPPMLEARHLAFQWPGACRRVWEDLHLRVLPGQCLAILGPNGSGKSTLLHVLAGGLSCQQGALHVADDGIRPACALLPQQPDTLLLNSTVRDELAYGPRQYGLSSAEVAARVETAAQDFALQDLLDEPPLELSCGQRLRLALAAMLAIRPRVLLLDEPTTGQDRATAERMMHVLRDQWLAAGRLDALLLATHDVSLAARWADTVLWLDEGRGVQGSAAEMLHENGRRPAAGGRGKSAAASATEALPGRILP